MNEIQCDAMIIRLSELEKYDDDLIDYFVTAYDKDKICRGTFKLMIYETIKKSRVRK